MGEAAAVSEYVKKLLFLMEYGVSYTACALMQNLGLKLEETFHKYYVNPPITAGLVEMIVPDKPPSWSQRYVRRGRYRSL